MCSLNLFPEPPPRDFITTCEVNGSLASAQITSLEFSRYISSLEVPPYKCISTSNIDDSKTLLNKSPFAPVADVDLWRKAFSVWTKHGIGSSLEVLSENEKTESLTWINHIARKTKSFINWSKSLRNVFYPNLMSTDEELLMKFASVRDWKCGLIRAFAWHPHLEKFAVAFYDDQVKIFSSKSSVPPQLKYSLQNGIADVKWRPNAASTLAVASASGIVIWYLDPTSLASTPSPATCVQMLTKSNHCPVTSIQWSPCGQYLMSCSPRDSTLMLWNVDTKVGLSIHQSGRSGVPFVRWSLEGSRLFSSSCSTVFRVWECENWTSDWWSSGNKRVVAACWSPEGTVLLIAVKDELVIYSITFTVTSEKGSDAVSGPKNAIPVIHLSQVFTDANDERLCIGGQVQSMVWDPTGTRLAVSFLPKESQELIAVFRTKTTPSFIVTPCGFVRGFPDEAPQCMAFKDIIKDGIILSVCWSSGRITHVRF